MGFCVPVPAGRYFTRVKSQQEKHIRKLLLRCGLDGNVNRVFVRKNKVALWMTRHIPQSLKRVMFDGRRNNRLIAFYLQTSPLADVLKSLPNFFHLYPEIYPVCNLPSFGFLLIFLIVFLKIYFCFKL